MTADMPSSVRSFHWAGYSLGFALGGFFDGILLHQILQWHHLLSLVDGVGDLRYQILFDGLFHALMYVIGAAGLYMLVRSRRHLDAPGAARLLAANALLGFGAWHIIDGVASHWVLGIHRIKIDSPNPLMWDLAWFFAFGVAPALVGGMMRRGSGGLNSGKAAAAIIAAATLGGGYWAAQPPADADTAIVVFRPGMDDGDAMRAIVESAGALVWQAGGVWAVRWDGDGSGNPGSLYRSGAVLVSNGLLAAGCLSWSRI